MQKVEQETALIALRSQFSHKRIMDNNLDEHPDWKEMIDLITKRAQGE
jgi:hypothetical protein